ncbi:MAG: Uncharacterized protein XD63_0689 [Thermoanaerobacterales bacterium 50_218]|nr:MAG: Uncharacterized protein XD63_0689 [Thermoanaerobacterales bacterium 50_218]HAA90183.1 hypothetical protein [Peptococcaceae bacterium]
MGGVHLSKLFIDTSAFIALMDKKDDLHGPAVDFYCSLDEKIVLITTIFIVSETYTWLRYKKDFKVAKLFLNVIGDALKTDFIEIVYPDQFMCEKIPGILEKYQDQDLSYTDAFSFLVIENMGIKDVFGFDSHFYSAKCILWPAVKK